MKILALDTATEACSVALYIDGTILEKYEVAPRRHAELVLPMLDGLLSEAGLTLGSLDGLAFGRGPGAFTGVRIATGVIQGLAYAADLPVVPVSTLAAMAQGAAAECDTIVSAIDARMQEIYLGTFAVDDNGFVTPLSDETVENPEMITLDLQSECFGVGTGWQTYARVLAEKAGARLKGFDPTRLPRARDILKLAIREFDRDNYVSAADAQPVYLRNRVTG